MQEPSWLPPCRDNVIKLGGTLCSQAHCDSSQIANYTHAFCSCSPPYQNGCLPPNDKPGCCGYNNYTPVFVAGINCYCCCGCFASETPVAYGTDDAGAVLDKPIMTFQIGDPVYVADSPDLSKWSVKSVAFSSGTGAFGGASTLIQIAFTRGGKAEVLYANRDQLFLMPDRTLKRASRLVPGKDQLVLRDGGTAPITALTVGKFKKGVHHIATSREPATSMDGHLILANGVVAGDFALQISKLESIAPQLLSEGHDELPEVGTADYARTHAHLEGTTFSAAVAADAGPRLSAAPVAPGEEYDDDAPVLHTYSVFEPLGIRPPAPIPASAQYWVTRKQAEDILRNAPALPPASGAGRDLINYLFRLFRGFYPDVQFYLDESNELPNAYSFVEYGKAFVVVNDQLLRTQAVGFELMALVIAHELGHLYAGPPQDRNGYSCAGQADYGAIAGILPYVFLGQLSVPIVGPAIEQAEKLFSYISPENRKGRPGNVCNYISIDCRLKAMNAAAHTLPLPECAGGPKDPTLEVIGATAERAEEGTTVTVSFNEPVDTATAEEVGNYLFDPMAPATGARVDPSDPAQVVVDVEVEEGVDYGVWVMGVLSAEGAPLVPDKNSARFTLAPEAVPAAKGAGS